MTMKPSNPEGFFTGLVSAALVDGRIDKKEERLLMDISHNLGIRKSVAEAKMQQMASDAAAHR
jgi:uncharacterized membrane protein YebE (DUF533 family)